MLQTRGKALAVALVIGALAASGTARAAELWRCADGLVQVGDSILAVEADCGPPDRRVRLVNGLGGLEGTAYYYKGAYGQAARKVVFDGGRVVRIERLD